MSKRFYNDKEKAEILAALDCNNGNVSLTARQLQIPRITLLDWSNDRKLAANVDPLRQVKKIELVSRFGEIIDLALDRVRDTIGGATCSVASLVACQAVDKMQLLKGAATQNIAHSIAIAPAQRAEKIADLRKKLSNGD